MCARFIVYDLLQLKSCYSWFQWLYRLAVEEVPEEDYMLPLSEAEVHTTSHPKWNKEENFCITLFDKLFCRKFTLTNIEMCKSGDSARKWRYTCWMGSSVIHNGTSLSWCWKSKWLFYCNWKCLENLLLALDMGVKLVSIKKWLGPILTPRASSGEEDGSSFIYSILAMFLVDVWL